MPQTPPPAIPSRLSTLRARVRARLLTVYLFRYTSLKRLTDVLISASILLLLMPLVALLAVLIRVSSPGPVLYWQTRIGQWGRPFAFPKFRSMYVDADARLAELATVNQHGHGSLTFKMRTDPRVTPVGRLMRRFSLDELPQLWCVLRGQMSLVGPRPPLPAEFERYPLAARARIEAKPGLTCIWQTEGRSEIGFEDQLMMDLEYLAERSLRKDLMLLLKTIPAVIFGRGAY